MTSTKPILNIVPNGVPQGPPLVVATYRDPAIVETERHDTRATRWALHRISLMSLAFHAGMLGWTAMVSFTFGREGRAGMALAYVAITGGVNGVLAAWAWARAKRSFS